MIEIHGALDLVFWILAVGVFALSGWALIHAVKTPARAFAATGKQTKKLWLVILGLAALFGFAAAVQYLSVLSIFTIASVIASGIYLADVRPAVGEIGRGGGNQGPYGPW
ncbi:DUF2516 family protein [Streptosporangium sp. NPDC000563]|uniref:DUF2516 family protein n=1 Tax=unclassified Streptosporangium TaxID=2632669 RepID=UPI00331E4695